MTGGQTFGSTMPAFTISPAPALPAGVGLSGTDTCTRVSSGATIGASLPAGSYTIDAPSCSGLSLVGPNSGVYSLSLAGGAFTVSRQSVSVTVSGTQVFGAAPNFTATPTSGSLPPGVTLSGTVSCTKVVTPVASPSAGPYTIETDSCRGLSLGGANAPDYTLGLVAGTFTMKPAVLQITVSGTEDGCPSDITGCTPPPAWTTPTFTTSPTSLPSGVLLVSGTVNNPAHCTTVNSGTPITPSLPPGTSTIDPGSCTGYSLTGPNAGNYTLSLVGGTFFVAELQ